MEADEAGLQDMGHLIHGTDVSASYSQLPMNQLDSHSELNQSSLAQDHAIERLAANLQAKHQEDGILIVGGGEIGMLDSSIGNSENSQSHPEQDALVDRQHSEGAIFETPRDHRDHTVDAKVHSSLLNIAGVLNIDRVKWH